MANKTIVVSEHIWKWLKEESRRRNTSIKALVEEALIQHYNIRKKVKPDIDKLIGTVDLGEKDSVQVIREIRDAWEDE